MLVRLLHGDCVTRMAGMADASVGVLCCDPPYGLRFMNKDFDDLGDGVLQQMWHAQWLTEAFRVLVPGGVAKVFGGSRVYHRLAAAMEQVGFTDIRLDAWGYGSGFPKSLNVAKALDKHLGIKPQVLGTVQSRNPHAQATGWGNQGTDNWRDAKRGTHPMPVTAPGSAEAEAWDGWGTALKPAWEPVLIGVKPEASP